MLPGQQDWCRGRPATDQKALAERKWQAPTKATRPQQPCDHGLFSDEAEQLDLVEMLQDPTNGERTMLWNQLLEDAIVGKAVIALVEEGFRLELCNQDGGGLFLYAAADGGEKPKSGYEHWVRLVPGNGADVIVDYTVSLEAALKPVNEFAAQFQT